MELARVLNVYPDGDSVDLRLVSGGVILRRVRVRRDACGSDYGATGLGQPSETNHMNEPGYSQQRSIIAVVDYTTEKRIPIVTGFLHDPALSEILFAGARQIHRLPCDVYWTADAAGNFELFHPSGAYIRIGDSPEHEDLTGTDVNEKFQLRHNTDKPVHVCIASANAGEVKASLTLAPDDKATLDAGGDVLVTTKGNATIKAVKVVIDAESSEFTGDVSIAGNTEMTGTLKVTGEAEFMASIKVAVDALVGGFKFLLHRHAGGTGGDGYGSFPLEA